ncbi:hypothetical protein [Escherichia coli]|uniref:hypothetical protein n=1 Tax=Escherichia coli TaxID=562 RepID=UPI00388F9CD4
MRKAAGIGVGIVPDAAPAAPSRIELTPGYFQINRNAASCTFMIRRYSLSSEFSESGLRISGRLKPARVIWYGAVLDSRQYQYQTGP